MTFVVYESEVFQEAQIVTNRPILESQLRRDITDRQVTAPAQQSQNSLLT
jgi:hypothetical protein